MTATLLRKKKFKIALAALELFAKRGYAETHLRDIAAITGTTEKSLDKHFESKSAILDYILEHCIKMKQFRISDDRINDLTEEATTDDIIACFNIYFPEDSDMDYFLVLDLIYKEKYRNNTVKAFFTKNFVLWQQDYVARILTRLIDLGVLKSDTNIDLWSQLHISISCFSTVRHLLGIGERMPYFKGKGMEDVLRAMYDTIFILHGTGEDKTISSG